MKPRRGERVESRVSRRIYERGAFAVLLVLTAAVLLSSALSACSEESIAAQSRLVKANAQAQRQPAQSARAEVVAGDSLRLIAHDENLPVGFPLSGKPLQLTNPHGGNTRAIATGAQLFVSYNCVDCHGVEGSGAVGPSFQDGRWRFGGSAGAIFESIYQGRPEGMPAWGGRISTDQIWMLAAYLQALPTKDVSTENFTGRTVERTGH